MTAAAEKRQSHRVSAAGVVGHLQFGNESMPCQVRNLSAGGVRIEALQATPARAAVALSLARVGWSKALRLTGQVVDSGAAPSLGVKFDALDPYARAVLSQLLRELGGTIEPAVSRPAPAKIPSELQKFPPQESLLLAQVSQLRQALRRSGEEISALKTQLVQKDQELKQLEREKAAAEMTVHSLAMRLASRAHAH